MVVSILPTTQYDLPEVLNIYGKPLLDAFNVFDIAFHIVAVSYVFKVFVIGTVRVFQFPWIVIPCLPSFKIPDGFVDIVKFQEIGIRPEAKQVIVFERTAFALHPACFVYRNGKHCFGMFDLLAAKRIVQPSDRS